MTAKQTPVDKAAREMFPAEAAAHDARRSWSFEHPSDEDRAEIRAIAKRIGKVHGVRISVRKGSGSIKHAIQVSTFRCENPAVVVEICEALLAAGFESTHAPYGFSMSLRGHNIVLARKWNHGDVSVGVARVAGAGTDR